MKVTVNARNGTREFQCEPGERILHAGLRHGVPLPYQCATGTCGSCRARLIDGRTEGAWHGAPGTRHFRGPDDLLTCQSVAREDCALEISAFRAAEFGGPRPAVLGGVLRDARRLTHDVMAFDVDLDRPLDFEAGQFALINVPGVVGARAYSMANFQPAARRLSFVAKNQPGGKVSDWLFRNSDGVEGAPVTLFAPLGHAIFHPGVKKHVLCIAGGSGIAGMASILRRGDQEGHFAGRDGHVFFGVRSDRDVFFLQDLEALRARHPSRLGITVAFSDQEVPNALAATYPGIAFTRGLVHAIAGERMKGRFADVRAYVAGPPSMVDASVRLLLREARLPPVDIRYDKFN